MISVLKTIKLTKSEFLNSEKQFFISDPVLQIIMDKKGYFCMFKSE